LLLIIISNKWGLIENHKLQNRPDETFNFSLFTMPDIVIKAENLGKKYVIGHQAERGGYTALRDMLMQNARTLCGNRGT
jgi:alpha-D-ribose 1-methylphosphonate 5-triphosphate synthase subunit PhnG